MNISHLVLFLLFVSCVAGLFAAPDDINTLTRRFTTLEATGDLYDSNGRIVYKHDADKMRELCEKQRADGSWADVHYASNTPGYWLPAIEHLGDRVLYLARAWHFSRDKESAKAVVQGLNYWIKARLRCGNWWWNTIGCPLAFGSAAIFVLDALPETERIRFADFLKDAKIMMSGQNRVWIAQVVMMRGILARNEKDIDDAVAAIQSEVKVSTGNEGIADDWCYRQHGPQLQFGVYGLSFIMNQSRLANILATTKWAFPNEKLEILGKLMENGFSWTMWKERMDVAALGRQIGPQCQSLKYESFAAARKEMIDVGWPCAPEPQGLRFFPKGAYLVSRSTNMMATVKMHTSQILETESWVIGENTLGSHLSDGALFVYETGREYEDIFPVWRNWRLIPGVTSYVDLPPVAHKRYHEWPPSNRADNMHFQGNRLQFVLDRDGLLVEKNWTFFDDRIVCEGTIVRATDSSSRVTTCVEHAWASPDLSVFPYNHPIIGN